MLIFELLIGLLILGASLSVIASRIGVPYPALIALAGAGLALIPAVPVLSLDPELALALFIAPVLLDTAFDTSPRDLKANWRAVTSLALGAVIITVGAVALVATHLVPELPLAAAIALGAIVAPPDAVAASAILKPLKPPYRLFIILEGESLFNDASALLIYRLAVAAAVSGAVSGWTILTTLFVSTLGSVILGLILAQVSVHITKRVREISIAVIIQFATTFVVWICAEKLHVSGIITVVVFAIAVSRKSPDLIGAKIRVPTWSIWEVAVFVLNVLAFFLIGLQFRSILARSNPAHDLEYFKVTAFVFLTVVSVRFGWVFIATLVRRSRARARGEPNPPFDVSAKGSMIIGWSGMRGTVTVATALALPQDFPFRDLILAAAFGVTLGTLVIQGMTLRLFMKWLNIEQDDSVDREARNARRQSIEAALDELGRAPKTATASLVTQSFELQLSRAKPEADATISRSYSTEEIKVVRKAFKAQRQALTNLRDNKTIGDAAFQRVEEEVDWLELGWMQLLERNEEHD